VPFIVRWPARVKKGKDCGYNICTTDLMATLADILDVELADNTAEDSKSFLPALLGKKLDDEARKGIVHHSDAGKFSIRAGDWKLVLSTGGGTRRKNPKDMPVINPADIELFDMENDPGESTNVQHLHPEVVEELKTLLARYIDDGRSTDGEVQANEPGKNWNQLEVLEGYLKNY
jgi:arylsulfatase A-like enzyme